MKSMKKISLARSTKKIAESLIKKKKNSGTKLIIIPDAVPSP